MHGIWRKLTRRGVSTDESSRAAAQGRVAEAEHLIAEGHSLEDAGQFEAALDKYRAATGVAPSFPRAHMNVGNALRRLERREEAIEAQRRAVACAPGFAQARFNLASLLAARDDREDAKQQFLESLRIDPSMFQSRLGLADIYEQEERYDDAERELRGALASAPEHPGILLNLGLFCQRQGRMEEALDAFRSARQFDPDFPGLRSGLLWSVNFRSDVSPDEIAAEHFRAGEQLARSAGPTFTDWPNDADPERRLRVGYVSGDFGPHPVAMFIRPVLERHDRSRFEVLCYSNHPGGEPIRKTLRERADHWRDIFDLDDAAVIDQLRRDRVDILVDLSGHTSHQRLTVFARHPAPVQATWLGYLNTTGLRAMDYRITDAHADPAGETEHLHTERLLRMPHSQWCYFAWHELARVASPHAERPAALVFGSFNQHAKLTGRTLALWSRILREMPRAELVVFDIRQEVVRDSVSRRMRSHGIDPDRVTMRGREAIVDYFAAIGNVDIALDTHPYNGATTTFDALWMGVPLVALRGDRGIARGSYSILRSLGADELIASSDDEYVDLNVRLATDTAWRHRLRDSLRERLAASPLMDTNGFTRALEGHYREAWRGWCAKRSSRA